MRSSRTASATWSHPPRSSADTGALALPPPDMVGPVSIRVVVAEDSLIVREGVEQVLAASPTIEVVATCDSLSSLLEAVAHHKPDVVLTDIRMPPTNTDEGIRAAALLHDEHPEVGVVVLSQFSEPEYVLDLLDSGSDGRGYLLKERVHNRGELVSAIDSVSRGGSVIDPKIVEVLVEEQTRAERSPLTQLTDREREVLAEIAKGKSNSAIAESLVLTKRAVEKHINSIFLKLGLAESDDVAKRVKAALMFLAEPAGPAPQVD
jgi:DNA-binding NarL/FixJ family response regulator